jgi:hypothetical protein
VHSVEKLAHQIEKIENIELSKSSLNSLNSTGVESRLKSCLICREKSENPYAARCGHICCFNCWQHWFKVKKACVICRVEIVPDSLIKITIK